MVVVDALIHWFYVQKLHLEWIRQHAPWYTWFHQWWKGTMESFESEVQGWKNGMKKLIIDKFHDFKMLNSKIITSKVQEF